MAGPNILGAKVLLDIFSANHVLYNAVFRGEMQAFGMADPNVSDYERRGIGQDGISYAERIFTSQPWSYTIETFKPINAFSAILRDQNPEDVTGEATDGSDEVVAVGGAIALDTRIDLIANILNADRTKVVASIAYIKSYNNAIPMDIPMEGSVSMALAGVATRGFQFNKPLVKEGWQHNCAVTEQGTPDDTVAISAGPAWLRRSTGTYEPRKVGYKGATSAAFDPGSANPRYDALVLYETGVGYNDLALTIVKGTEAASPVKVTDGAIDTAVDAIDADARWVRLADIYVDELITVVINTADINAVTNTVFTLNKTALALPSKVTSDSLMLYSNAIALWENGELKENNNNVTSISTTTLTLSAAVGDMIDILYITEPYTYVNPLAG